MDETIGMNSRNARAAGAMLVRAQSNGGQHQMKFVPLKSGATMLPPPRQCWP
jgi:hypothetical protein